MVDAVAVKVSEELMRIDQSMAAVAARRGLYHAFESMIAADGVIMPSDGHLIVGRQKLQSLERQGVLRDLVQPQWQVLRSEVSSDGNLGYSHGRYPLPEGAEKGDDGYYITVWKRAGNGRWQLAFSQGLLRCQLTMLKPFTPALTRPLRPVEEELLAAERAFNAHSVNHGATAAFFHFMADTGIALGASGPPRTKAFYLEQMGKQNADVSGERLQWQPAFTCGAGSGDMGYNFGPYQYTVVRGSKRSTFYGYFITVWHKQSDGTWKFLIDGGNVLTKPADHP
jgi:ketosteroid isomerase-like protein